jgi:hypothetical protein
MLVKKISLKVCFKKIWTLLDIRINTTEASGNNVNNTDSNKDNLADVNGNNNEVNNIGLLSNQKKRRNICGC